MNLTRMSWASDIPSELLCQPMGVVILTGLNITHNPVHKAVCDAFSVNRHADRVSVCFMSFGLDHIYPKPKLEVSFCCEKFIVYNYGNNYNF